MTTTAALNTTPTTQILGEATLAKLELKGFSHGSNQGGGQNVRFLFENEAAAASAATDLTALGYDPRAVRKHRKNPCVLVVRKAVCHSGSGCYPQDGKPQALWEEVLANARTLAPYEPEKSGKYIDGLSH